MSALCAREWWHSSSGRAARSSTALYLNFLKNLKIFKTSFIGVGDFRLSFPKKIGKYRNHGNILKKTENHPSLRSILTPCATFSDRSRFEHRSATPSYANDSMERPVDVPIGGQDALCPKDTSPLYTRCAIAFVLYRVSFGAPRNIPDAKNRVRSS